MVAGGNTRSGGDHRRQPAATAQQRDKADQPADAGEQGREGEDAEPCLPRQETELCHRAG
jgi:hypothetical protein